MTPAQLRHYRSELGLTRSEFGELLGVSAGEVLRWERGIPPMPDSFVLALAVAYVQLCVESRPMRAVPRRGSDENRASADR